MEVYVNERFLVKYATGVKISTKYLQILPQDILIEITAHGFNEGFNVSYSKFYKFRWLQLITFKYHYNYYQGLMRILLNICLALRVVC